MWTSVLLVHPVTHDVLSNFEIFAMVNFEIEMQIVFFVHA